MKKARDVLIDVLGGIHLEGEMYVSFFNSWNKIAGTDISNHSRLTDIKNGILYMEVDHPGWIQLIQLRKREILKKTKSMFPQLEIRDIRIFLEKHKKAAPEKDNKQDKDSRDDEKLRFDKILERLGRSIKKDDELT
ncbi:MAG: hypothetical protein DRP59_05095 [Spirochaetes bacterium]|nr:MAG: hypothetical protein DRP59_05095 [Spirochaetota bacterium]